jgi:hypothetical protein
VRAEPSYCRQPNPQHRPGLVRFIEEMKLGTVQTSMYLSGWCVRGGRHASVAHESRQVGWRVDSLDRINHTHHTRSVVTLPLYGLARQAVL